MSALNFARQVFNPEKPHSSITDWVELLTAGNIAEEAYDGIPELVDSINLQGLTGPTEASRALRKKLKHGNPHQQYRSLVILKALVENCTDKFRHSFADAQMIDCIRSVAASSYTDKRVQKKLKLVLLSWNEQFKGEPSMRNVAELHTVFRDRDRRMDDAFFSAPKSPREDKRREEEERRREEEERRRAEKEERKRQKETTKQKPRQKRQPFNFEQEKPKVLASIVEASQASSNLVNAITLVNTEKESIETNARVQEWLAVAKQVRKAVVRYVQLVEQEEIIGVLIETNDRIITALEMYDQVLAGGSGSKGKDKETAAPSANNLSETLAKTHLTGESVGELSRLQDKQRAEVQRAKSRNFHSATSDDGDLLHPDLQDLSFGGSSSNLPPPLRPTRTSMSDEGEEQRGRGSLSDFSDYESSDEETHRAGRKTYVTVSDNEEDIRGGGGATAASEDPFADPFADANQVPIAVGGSRR